MEWMDSGLITSRYSSLLEQQSTAKWGRRWMIMNSSNSTAAKRQSLNHFWKFVLQNSASPSSRGRLLYIHPVGRSSSSSSSSRFVTINSTSIKPSMKVRNLTYMHHIIPSASYLTQCIISAPSVHHQSIMSASLVHHHCIIRASSGHQKHIISK